MCAHIKPNANEKHRIISKVRMLILCRVFGGGCVCVCVGVWVVCSVASLWVQCAKCVLEHFVAYLLFRPASSTAAQCVCARVENVCGRDTRAKHTDSMHTANERAGDDAKKKSQKALTVSMLGA